MEKIGFESDTVQLTHTGETLNKVYAALLESGLSDDQAAQAINAILNARIRFREMI